MSKKRPYSLKKGSTKRCGYCGQFRDIAEFGWSNKATKDALQPNCKTCNVKISQDNYTSGNKYAVDYLKSHPCVDCGFSDYRALDFDHIRGEKLYNVKSMWRLPHKNRSALVKAEIAKCEVRCKNCHQIRHLEEGYPVRKTGYDLTKNEEYEEPSPQLSFLDMLG